MTNVMKVPLQQGGVQGSKVEEMITGTVAIDLPSTTTGSITSASAAPTFTGEGLGPLTTAHSLVLTPQAGAATNRVTLVGADVTAENVITVTGGNAATATLDPASQTYAFFAWKSVGD
jgi:hypothetical protein